MKLSILPKLIFFAILILIAHFASPKIYAVGAYCETQTAQWSDGNTTTLSGNMYYLANCTQGNPQTYCDRTNWTLYYNPKCTVANFNCTEDDWNNERCPVYGNANCAWSQSACSTADRCYDPSIGNVTGSSGGGGASGYDPAGQILPGICDETKFDGTNPSTACVAGGIYKQCCSPGGNYPITACQNGSCPNGQYLGAGITTCNASPTPSCQGTALSCTNPQCQSGYTAVKITNGNYVCANTSTGQIDCNTAPSCPSSVCPNSGIWRGGPCNPNDRKADSCSNPGAYPTTCNLCSVSSCALYQSNVYCWQNTGQCYNDPAFCSAYTTGCFSCGRLGSTQTICPNSTIKTCNR